jgi:hypothetical protein
MILAQLLLSSFLTFLMLVVGISFVPSFAIMHIVILCLLLSLNSGLPLLQTVSKNRVYRFSPFGGVHIVNVIHCLA